jgi:Transglutaminase-like superfamily
VTARYAPLALTAPEIEVHSIPAGYPGTLKTVAHVARLIREGARDFYVRQKAIDILMSRAVKPKDYAGEIKALFEWVQQNIRYTKDPFQAETLHSARRLLELKAGDCDDISILLGAMLEAIGHPVRRVITGPSPVRPNLYTHIYVEAFLRGQWIPLDATMPHPMGWAPQGLIKQTIPVQRRSDMTIGYGFEGYLGAPPAPDLLRGLIRGIRQDGGTARDPRVKQLWATLRQRGLLARSTWVKRVLLYAWKNGYKPRPRPKTARRFVRQLRAWGILPPRAVGTVGVRALSLRPVGRARPVARAPVTRLRPLTRMRLQPARAVRR